jgi:hypothetical protein
MRPEAAVKNFVDVLAGPRLDFAPKFRSSTSLEAPLVVQPPLPL